MTDEPRIQAFSDPTHLTVPLRPYNAGERRTPKLMLFGAALSGLATGAACIGKFSTHIHSGAVMGWSLTAAAGLVILLAKAAYDYQNCRNKQEAKENLISSLTSCLIMLLFMGAIGAGAAQGIANAPGRTGHGMV